MNMKEEKQPTRFFFFWGEWLYILISLLIYLVSIFIDFRLSEIEGNYKTLPNLQETKESDNPEKPFIIRSA